MVKKIKEERPMSEKLTNWIGTPTSIALHTLFFLGMFMLPFLGAGLDKTLLILTTVVSLEAIYLALFIQMTVNRNTASLEAVEEDIDEIQEDQDEDEKRDKKEEKDLDNIELQLQKVLNELETLRKSRTP